MSAIVMMIVVIMKTRAIATGIVIHPENIFVRRASNAFQRIGFAMEWIIVETIKMSRIVGIGFVLVRSHSSVK